MITSSKCSQICGSLTEIAETKEKCQGMEGKRSWWGKGFYPVPKQKWLTSAKSYCCILSDNLWFLSESGQKMDTKVWEQLKIILQFVDPGTI